MTDFNTPEYEFDKRLLAIADESVSQTAVWLLGGNAAALLFCMNAAIDSKVCDWASLKWIAVAYAVGVILAFASTWARGIDARAARAFRTGMGVEKPNGITTIFFVRKWGFVTSAVLFVGASLVTLLFVPLDRISCPPARLTPPAATQPAQAMLPATSLRLGPQESAQQMPAGSSSLSSTPAPAQADARESPNEPLETQGASKTPQSATAKP